MLERRKMRLMRLAADLAVGRRLMDRIEPGILQQLKLFRDVLLEKKSYLTQEVGQGSG
jgi:hypothetical protein